jgi:hypothetical protein
MIAAEFLGRHVHLTAKNRKSAERERRARLRRFQPRSYLRIEKRELGAARRTRVASRTVELRRTGRSPSRSGRAAAYESDRSRARRQVTTTCPLVSVTAVATTHLPSLRHSVSPTFGTFSLSVSSPRTVGVANRDER